MDEWDNDLFSKNMIDLPIDELGSYLNSNTSYNHFNYIKRKSKNIVFKIHSLTMNIVSTYVLSKTDSINEINQLFFDGKLENITAFLNENEIYESLLNEKVYVESYSCLEWFISRQFVILYWLFPKFLMADSKDEKLSSCFDDIFNNENILITRKNIIEQKVKDMIQSNNIIDILNRFKSIFGINIDLSNEIKKELFIISNNRNVLIHNNGVINDTYFQNLKKYKIETPYQLGFNISNILSDILSPQSNFVDEIENLLFSSIKNQTEQVQAYYKNKYFPEK